MSLHFPETFRMLKQSPLGASATLLYLWLLFDLLKGELGIVERTSCHEISLATGDTKDAVTKQLQELERREFISVDRYRKGGDGSLQSRGDIRIWVFHPNAAVRGPRPKRKLRPEQGTFDFEAVEDYGTRQFVSLGEAGFLDVTDPDELITVNLGGCLAKMTVEQFQEYESSMEDFEDSWR